MGEKENGDFIPAPKVIPGQRKIGLPHPFKKLL